MMQSQDRDAVALSARTLGALFSFAPDSEQAAPLVAALRDGSWRSQWPYAVTDGLAALFAREDDEPLPEAWQRLFIGPWALPAPPWGSVWLDKESVLFGDSTLALREWMRVTGIALSEQRSEPEDHFGTLLLLAAWLCESPPVVRPLSERICGRGESAFLSGSWPAGARDAGAMAGAAALCGGRETALPLTPSADARQPGITCK